MPGVHAKLSPSSAHRWMMCPASVRLESTIPNKDTAYTREGTAAHALAEQCLRHNCIAETNLGETIAGVQVDAEMVDAVNLYLDYVRIFGGEVYPEVRVDYSHLVAGGFGTSDAVVFEGDTLHVVDLKYGKGVRVSAEHNPQAQIYGLGALHDFGFLYDNIKHVNLAIVQPRLDNISEWQTTPAELNAFGEQVRAAAEATYQDNAPANPSDDACKFCRAKAVCRAYAEANLRAIKADFEDLTMQQDAPAEVVLSNAELAEALRRVPSIKSWLTAVEDASREKLMAGEEVPGYKLVAGRSLRKWSDDDDVIAALKAAGKAPESYLETKLLSVAKMEKALGKTDLIFKEFVIKPEGAPTVVPDSDKRPALILESASAGFEPIEN